MKNSFIGLLIASSLSLLSCGEELFDAAQSAADGYNFAFAVVDTGVERRMLITDGGSYRKEMTINGMPFNATSPSKICVDQNGRIFASYWDGVWVYNGSSGWMTTLPMGSATVMDIVSRDGEVFALVSESTKNIYRYESGSGTSWMLDKLGEAGTTGMACPNDDGIYLYSSAGVINNYPDSTVAGTFSLGGGGTPLFLDRNNGVFFVGITNGYNLDGSFYATGLTSAHAYTVVDSSAAFGIGLLSTFIKIVKINLDDHSYTTLPPDFGVTGTGLIEHLNQKTLVIGINGSSTNNGLWIYKTDSGALTQITSVPVYGLYVRR